MTATSSLLKSHEVRNDQNRICAALVEEPAGYHFKLSHRGQTLMLDNSRSLNKWVATGLTDHHSIRVSTDGVEIDGKKISYLDAHATEELEELLNHSARFQSGSSATPPSTVKAEPSISEKTSALSDSPRSFSSDTIKVTTDGFIFHVSYMTKFGETRTEDLESALTSFQKMGVLKPHMTIQKLGTRLVVTEWDGEEFVEASGIDSLDRAAPGEIEAVLRSYLLGTLSATNQKVIPGTVESKAPVARIELAKKHKDMWFQIILHRADGTVEEGPLLIRANTGKLQATRCFRPDVRVSMTIMNDQLIVERGIGANDDNTRQVEKCPLITPDDANKAELLLNECLARPGIQSVPKSEVSQENRCAPVPGVPIPTSSTKADKPKAVHQAPPATAASSNITFPTSEPAHSSPLPRVIAKPSDKLTDSHSTKTSASGNVPKGEQPARFLVFSDSQPTIDTNRRIFELIQVHFDMPAILNDHGFPSITLGTDAPDNAKAELEIVLMHETFLVGFPFGYLRFGLDTRAYLNSTDDYVAFSGNALRGFVEPNDHESLVFVVCEALAIS